MSKQSSLWSSRTTTQQTGVRSESEEGRDPASMTGRSVPGQVVLVAGGGATGCGSHGVSVIVTSKQTEPKIKPGFERDHVYLPWFAAV